MTLDDVLDAYRQGIFPMADERDATQTNWFTARRRGIIPMDGFHMPKRALRYVRIHGYECRIDTAFADVVAGCADRPTTWINHDIEALFKALHVAGHAHSIEVWQHGALIGGLYGLAIGRAFFAESIFQRKPEAMKASLWFCHRHLSAKGFGLWDVQFLNAFLEPFGCVEISAATYKARLQTHVKLPAPLRFAEREDG
jgi:leucyl/phenylalanyl-tRNA--protein transferase